MLVDNGVHGDSRVQKVARSAAQMGWDVILLGRSPDGKPRRWRLGDARVRLLTVPLTTKARYQVRRAPLRRPLAYPPGPVIAQRKREVELRRLKLTTLRAKLAAADRSRLVSRGTVLVTKVVYGVANRWVRVRLSQTESLAEARKNLAGPIDRFAVAFWEKAMGKRSWRQLDPMLWDYELSFGPVIDKLRPAIIHAHDSRMIAVGARAKLRAQARGRDVKLVWDAHEYRPGVGHSNPRRHVAYCANELEFVPYADSVITVSEPLADLLIERHKLTTRPSIVLNAPDVAWRDDAGEAPPKLRDLCGITDDTPLLVYCGVASAPRGLDIMVEALPMIPAAHVALVINNHGTPYVRKLVARAKALQAGHRLHILPYVDPYQIVPFLSQADAGVHPLHHTLNHEIGVSTKFYEYAHAGLPIVVSDVKLMTETIQQVGNGVVFKAKNLADYIRAVYNVLDDPRRYRAAYEAPGLLDAWTWARQARILGELYDELKPRTLA